MNTEKLAKAVYFLNANYKTAEIEKIENNFIYFVNKKVWSIDALNVFYIDYIKHGRVAELW